MSENIFDISNLNLFYGTHQALFDVNLSIPRNEVTALIGPSGCGKSTFLKCLNRMNDLVEGCKIDGQILLNDENIMKMNPIILRTKVGMVFQQPNPFPMSIYENVIYGLKCQGIKDKKLLNEICIKSLKEAALFEEVKDKLKSSAYQLSGGQKQRLCIARALAMRPDVLLMDEPTSALDPIATSKIEELINTLKEKYTIVIVTHNMQQATRISDNTAFFMLGRIVEFNSTEEFFSKPKEKESNDYITGRFS
mgnify:CR=1 FL=1